MSRQNDNWWNICTVIGILAVVFAVGYFCGQHDGYPTAYANGVKFGYSDGFNHGYFNGYDFGKSQHQFYVSWIWDKYTGSIPIFMTCQNNVSNSCGLYWVNNNPAFSQEVLNRSIDLGYSKVVVA